MVLLNTKLPTSDDCGQLGYTILSLCLVMSFSFILMFLEVKELCIYQPVLYKAFFFLTVAISCALKHRTIIL